MLPKRHWLNNPRRKNNRKSTNGRINQYVVMGSKTKLIKHDKS